MAGPWEQYQSAPAAAPTSTKEAGPWSNYAAPTGADEKAAPIRIKNRAQLVALRLDHPEQKALSDADFLDWFGKSRTVPTTAILDDGQAPEPPKDTSAGTGFAGGFLKPVDNLATWVTGTRVGKAVDEFGQKIGFPSADAAVAHNDAMRANNTRTGWQTIGNIAATIPLSRLPGGVAVQGAASGALLSDAKDARGIGMDAAKSAVFSKAAGLGFNALGSLATGVKDAGLRALNAAGVPLTVGQLASAGKGVISRTIAKGEEALTSVPWVGDMINVARDRGITAINTALGNRILANVGDKLAKGVEPGHETVEAVTKHLSSRYETLIPKLRGVMDGGFIKDITKAKAITATLPRQRQQQLAAVVDDVFRNRTNGAVISGKSLKEAESQLTTLISKYKGARGDEAVFADALEQVRTGLRNMVVRSNPANAAELKGLNTAWAQLKALRKAISSGSDMTKATGVVSPGGALRVTAREGFRDPLLEAATKTIPNRTPDSGTARRGLMGLGSLLAGGGAAGATISPALAFPAAASLLYTKAGQKALNAAAFGNRPLALRGTAIPLKQLAKYAPALVAPLAVSPKQ